MKMYIVKEPHELLSGFKTVKYRWWYNVNGSITPKQCQIMHDTDMRKEFRIFKGLYPDGEVLTKDKTK